MRVRVLTPLEVVLDREASRITAHGDHGFFTLLPRHVDCVATLVPGLLFVDEEVLALDEGVALKQGADVWVTVRDAVRQAPLEALRQAVEERFLTLDEHERRARSALAMLEAGTLRRLVDLR